MRIAGSVLNWVTAFLSYRQQNVNVNGSYSDWINVTSGVPLDLSLLLTTVIFYNLILISLLNGVKFG